VVDSLVEINSSPFFKSFSCGGGGGGGDEMRREEFRYDPVMRSFLFLERPIDGRPASSTTWFDILHRQRFLKGSKAVLLGLTDRSGVGRTEQQDLEGDTPRGDRAVLNLPMMSGMDWSKNAVLGCGNTPTAFAQATAPWLFELQSEMRSRNLLHDLATQKSEED
jgi:hypothetical protein